MPCAEVIIWRSHLVAATPPSHPCLRDNGARSSTLVGGCCDQPQKWQVWHSAWQRRSTRHSTPARELRHPQTMKTQLDETRHWLAVGRKKKKKKQKRWKKPTENYFLEKCRRMAAKMGENWSWDCTVGLGILFGIKIHKKLSLLMGFSVIWLLKI